MQCESGVGRRSQMTSCTISYLLNLIVQDANSNIGSPTFHKKNNTFNFGNGKLATQYSDSASRFFIQNITLITCAYACQDVKNVYTIFLSIYPFICSLSLKFPAFSTTSLCFLKSDLVNRRPPEPRRVATFPIFCNWTLYNSRFLFEGLDFRDREGKAPPRRRMHSVCAPVALQGR